MEKDKKLTDNEIKKALDYWKKFDAEIDEMMLARYKGDKDLIKQKEIVKITFEVFDLINRKDEEIEWLRTCNDGNLEFISQTNDLINRLQEKVEENEDTIQFADKIHKEQVAENKRLVNAVNRLTNRICDLKEKDETRRKVFETKCEELEIAKAENERLKKEKDEYAYLYDKHINTAFSHIKAEAYKEFAKTAIDRVEKAKAKYQRLCKEQGEEMEEHMHIHFNGITKVINNLLKELVDNNG